MYSSIIGTYNWVHYKSMIRSLLAGFDAGVYTTTYKKKRHTTYMTELLELNFIICWLVAGLYLFIFLNTWMDSKVPLSERWHQFLTDWKKSGIYIVECLETLFLRLVGLVVIQLRLIWYWACRIAHTIYYSGSLPTYSEGPPPPDYSSLLPQ